MPPPSEYFWGSPIGIASTTTGWDLEAESLWECGWGWIQSSKAGAWLIAALSDPGSQTI